MTSYLFNNAKHSSLSRQLVVDYLAYFYNSKSFLNGLASLFKRWKSFSFFVTTLHSISYIVSAFKYAFCLLWNTSSMTCSKT